jgi:dihydrofolate reductase
MIAAASENNALGKSNRLLWHLPDDFKRFKKLTSGHPIIMGRKTFASLKEPLPDRKHIIITRDKDFSVSHADCSVVHSMEEALKVVADKKLSFIIGGGEIYQLGEPFANKIELTRVHATFDDADTYFPEIDEHIWKLIESEYHPIDAKHNYEFTYLTYVRKGIEKL